MVGKDATFQVGPGPCQPLGKKPAPTEEQGRGLGGRWAGGECAGSYLVSLESGTS